MTDSFSTENTSGQEDQNTTQSFGQQEDKTTGQDKGVDTTSLEYQIQKLEQRLNDKDGFIETLKGETSQLRDSYSELAERANNLERIKEEVLNKNQDVASQNNSLDEDELANKVIENLNKQEQAKTQEQNFNSVKQRINEEFGSQHVDAKVREAAEKAGLSFEDMFETAKKSPKAFYTLMGIDQPKGQGSTQPMRSSTQNIDTSSGEKGFEYFNNLRRTDPRTYWKPEVQREYRKLFEFNKDK